MSTNNIQVRTPGSFSSVIGQSSATQPDVHKIDSALPGGDVIGLRSQKPQLETDISHNSMSHKSQIQTPRPPYALSQGNRSSSSLHGPNVSRTTMHDTNNNSHSRPEAALRNANHGMAQKTSNADFHRHGRKHSSTQGSFEAYLPTAANSNLGNMANPNGQSSASHIAAQAVMQHQTHLRQRSQTVPTPQIDPEALRSITKGSSNPLISNLIDVSRPQDNGISSPIYNTSLVGGTRGNVAQTAANIVFSKSPISPPIVSSAIEQLGEKEKPIKSEKSKVKLFSRPGKTGTSRDKETKAGPLPSPNKIAFTSIQRGNNITTSALETRSSASSMYSVSNSSSATIRPIETEEKKVEREKERPKHHFLSRQKHKLTSKDEHNLPLSSAASNSKPVDPNAPSSLYNFNLPLSPSTNGAPFSKSMSGLDLRHGGRALRERKKEKDERSEITLKESEISNQNNSSECPGPSSLGSGGGTSFLAASSISYVSSICGYEATAEIAKNGLERLAPEDAWPFLRTKLLAVFDGEDIRLPVEDLNLVVTLHLQSTYRKRTPTINMINDLHDLLQCGFASLDQIIRRLPEDRLISQLVELWLFTLTTILPFMQAVFLPLDSELSKALPANKENNIGQGDLSVRSMVLRSFRDVVILSRFETLRNLFGLDIEKISHSLLEPSVTSTSPDAVPGRPGTSMSLDPSLASHGSQKAIFLESLSQPTRSRTISNVSNQFMSESPSKSSFYVRERGSIPADSGRLLSETVSRILQCIGVLASVHDGPTAQVDVNDIKDKMNELVKSLKLNWLGRTNIESNKRGLAGARVRVPVFSFGAAIEV